MASDRAPGPTSSDPCAGHGPSLPGWRLDSALAQHGPGSFSAVPSHCCVHALTSSQRPGQGARRSWFERYPGSLERTDGSDHKLLTRGHTGGDPDKVPRDGLGSLQGSGQQLGSGGSRMPELLP